MCVRVRKEGTACTYAQKNSSCVCVCVCVCVFAKKETNADFDHVLLLFFLFVYFCVCLERRERERIIIMYYVVFVLYKNGFVLRIKKIYIVQKIYRRKRERERERKIFLCVSEKKNRKT